MARVDVVVMPKWGMEMTEGEIAEWHVHTGDTVAQGDDVVDVETAKIVNTVTASAAGTVARVCAEPGDVVAVGAALVVLTDGDASDEEIETALAGIGSKGEGKAAPAPEPAPEKQAPTAEAEKAAPPPAAEPAPSGALPASLAEGPDDSAVAATAVARRLARENGINLTRVSASGRHDRVTVADLRAAAEGAGGRLELPGGRDFGSAALPDDGAVKASPVARRLAAELGVNLHECRPSGRHGRVAKADVEAVAARRGPRQSPSREPAGGAEGDAAAAPESATLTGMRRAIAQRVQQAKRDVPHFRVNMDIDVGPAMALRAQLNAARRDVKLSLNDILIKACACALRDNPALNARFDGETLERHGACHIATAVAIDGGVMMPVLRDVGGLGLVAVSTAMRDLATRAKIGRLTAEELDGGTFSISNLGMFGISSFDAIINQPAVAILAVGTAEQRPIVRDGELAAGHMMSVSLASDHRVVDGADAARFLADLRGFLEAPATMLG